MWVGPWIIRSATTRDYWIIPFQIGGYVLHVEHILWVIKNSCQHQCVTTFTFSIALQELLLENIACKWQSLFSDSIFKVLLFYIFCAILLFLCTFFWFQSIGYYYMAYMDYMDSDVRCPRHNASKVCHYSESICFLAEEEVLKCHRAIVASFFSLHTRLFCTFCMEYICSCKRLYFELI